MSGTPHFSVIIPTYQRNDMLAKCLECLAPGRQEGMMLVENGDRVANEKKESGNGKMDTTPVIPPICGGADSQASAFQSSNFASYEVIVADDGRVTTSEAMLREQFPWARWVSGPGTGPAANRNAGAAVARGKWLVFTDDDCLPQPVWLRAFREAIESHPKLSVFEGKTVPDRPRRSLSEHAPVGSQGGNLWSCNFTILRSVFELLAGFDAQFRVCLEDSDFALRVKQAGIRFPFVEQALALHPWRPRKLGSDGWKSSGAEMDDHLRFKQKHPSAESMNSIRLARLGLRVFWCDFLFICQHIDFKGVPFAIGQLIQLLRLAVVLSRCTQRSV